MKEMVLNALIENGYKYNYYGLRTDDRILSVGEEVGDSLDTYWDNDEETYLDGTSATGFGCLWYDDDDMDEVEKALKIQESYVGSHMYLIAGDSSTYGDDPAEVIIRNAVVVAVIK